MGRDNIARVMAISALTVSMLIAIFLISSSNIDPEQVQSYDFIETVSQPRSPKWEHIRGEYVREHPTCAACGKNYNLNVHHIIPVHINPSLELDKTNLITLCRPHHFTIGHLNNWKDYNPNVVKDARKFKETNK